jgi:hypothetical protein
MSQTYESKILDHLGLVTGMYDDLEIGEEIDSRIAQNREQRKVSVGKVVKAMVINGLGFIEQRLYLTTQFFETLPKRHQVACFTIPNSSRTRGPERILRISRGD